MPKLTILFVADTGRQIAGLLVQNLLFVALAVWIWRRQRVTPAQIGLQRPTSRQVLRALMLGVGVFVVAYGSGMLLERTLWALLPSRSYGELVRLNRQVSAEGGFVAMGQSVWLRAIFVFTGTVIAPLGEEALFRGLLYRALRARWGVRAAIIGSSLVFALVHVSPLTIGIIFLIGVMLATAYERTGSFWTPVLMHGVNNALMFALLWQQTR